MTTGENIAPCRLGLTSKDISTWRAQGCTPAVARRIEEHIATCAACQNHLSAYETIDVALVTQKIPMPSSMSWQALVPFLHAQRQHGVSAQSRGLLWRSLAALAALVLVVGGFAEVLGFGLLGTRSSPSASQHLSWHPGKVPQTIEQWYVNSSWHLLPISVSDGTTLYGCSVPAKYDSPAIWVTHDRAATWTQVGVLPITRPDINQCYLTVDMLNRDIAIAVVGWDTVKGAPGPAPGMGASFVTFDDGQSWQALTDPQCLSITQLASRRGVTYAFFDGGSASERRVMVSTDQMQTWHRIDKPIVEGGQHIWSFALDPGSETIIATVGKDGDVAKQLWITDNNGQTWRQLLTPIAEQFVVHAPSAGQSWMICARHYNVTQARTLPNEIFCSVDGGQHWQRRAALNGTALVSLPMLNPPLGKTYIQLISITDDGSLVALDPGPSTGVLYRLPAGADQWQMLGALPRLGRTVVTYSPRPGPGILWISNTTKTDLILFTASYS